MPDLKKQRQLNRLVAVKGLRKSLAEADYLRCAHRQRQLNEERLLQDGRLRKYRTEIPARRATILRQLAGTPVNLQTIHTTHEIVLGLGQRLAAMEQEQLALEDGCRHASEITLTARTRLTAAMHQVEKFGDTRLRGHLRIAAATDTREEMELEDRPHHSFYSLAADTSG